MKLKISVTKDDISRGRRHEPARCPIALSLIRTSEFDAVSVGRSRVIVMKDGLCYRSNFDQNVQSFIERFDEEFKLVDPFETELEFNRATSED